VNPKRVALAGRAGAGAGTPARSRTGVTALRRAAGAASELGREADANASAGLAANQASAREAAASTGEAVGFFMVVLLRLS